MLDKDIIFTICNYNLYRNAQNDDADDDDGIAWLAIDPIDSMQQEQRLRQYPSICNKMKIN